MAGEDRFAALIRQLTEQLRREHEHQIGELVAEIGDLKSRLRGYEQSPPQHGDVPLAQDAQATAPSAPTDIVSRMRAASTQSSRVQSRLCLAPASSAQQARARNSCLAGIERVVQSSFFEIFFSVLIALNGVLLAVEAQHASISVASLLEYRDVSTPTREWDGAEGVFAALGWVVGVLFLVELLMRIAAYRQAFPCDIWNLLDTVIVLAWALGEALPDIIPINPQIIRLARFARLVRLLKLARKIGTFDSLFLMMTSLAHSSVILVWTGILLVLVMLFTALLMNGALTEFYFKNEGYPVGDRREVFRYYGTFSTAIFSMFELTLANWPPISRLLYEKVTGWFIVITLAHKLMIGFAIIGVINGVFIQETFKVAQQDDEIMMRKARQASSLHATKMKRLMKTADSSGEGTLDLPEFRMIFEDPGMKAWFASMEFNPGDVDLLFHMIDDGDGALTVEEVIAGVAKLKGGARNLDLHTLMLELRHFRRQFEKHFPTELDV